MFSATKFMASVALAAMATTVAGCDTAGSTRLAGIGPSGNAGASSGGGSGDSGSGTSGTSGTTSDGGSGTSGSGTDGGGTVVAGGGTGTGSGAGSGATTGGSGATTGSGLLASLPIGSVTGSGGAAGTGVLPDVGKANQESPLAPVLVTAGNAALGLSDATNGLTNATASGALAPVTAAVQQTLANTGTALKDGASGTTPLLDGVTKALAPVATVAAGGGTLVGDTAGTSLVAVSAGSPARGSGSLVDLHLAKDMALPAASNLLGAQVAGTTLAQPTATPAVDVKVLSSSAPEATALGVGVASGGAIASVSAPALNGVTSQVTNVTDAVLAKAGSALPSSNGLLGVQVGNATVIPAAGTPAVDAKVLSPSAANANALGVGVLSGGKVLNVTLPGVTNAATTTPAANPLATAVGGLLHH